MKGFCRGTGAGGTRFRLLAHSQTEAGVERYVFVFRSFNHGGVFVFSVKRI